LSQPPRGERIRLAWPQLGDRELSNVAEVLRSGLVSQGPKSKQFEDLVCERLDVSFAFATSSGTTALHLALAAAGIGPGDEVLVADFTFPATGNVVLQQGARPVLVDIDPRLLAMSPEDARRKATRNTRALLPVHPFGAAADMDALMKLAGELDLAVIEDAATAFGGNYRGRSCGTIGNLGCFSFHGRKVITTGEGGMVVTDDEDLADRVRVLRNHGGVRIDGRYAFADVGYNYRMSDVQAAIGIAQLERLDDLIAALRESAHLYDRLLDGAEHVTIPPEPEWGRDVHQSYVVLLDSEVDRDAVIREMASRGIETTLGTYALHAEPAYARLGGYAPGDLPASFHASRHSLALPLYSGLTNEQVDYVSNSLRAAVAGCLGKRGRTMGEKRSSEGQD